MSDFIAGFIVGVGACLMVIGTIMALATEANAQYDPDYPIPATPVIVQEPNFAG